MPGFGLSTSASRNRHSNHMTNMLLLSVGHNVISISTTAKSLRFYFRDEMRIDEHIQDICCKACIDIRRISSIHHLLSIDVTKTLLSAFAFPKFDYCNYLLYDSPMYILKGLQKVQNSTARLIFNVASKFTFHPFSYLCSGSMEFFAYCLPVEFLLPELI